MWGGEGDRCRRLSAAGRRGPSQAAALRLCFLEWKPGSLGTDAARAVRAT